MEHQLLWFQTVCRQNGLILADHQIKLFQRYVELLLEWNKKINLISKQDEAKIWQHHFFHCVSILFKIQFPAKSKILDLGTGGGLPGIPLKIVLPDTLLTLLDSTQKKIMAVKDVMAKLSLIDVQAVWGRAEELGKTKGYHRAFDIVVARGVAPLKKLTKWSFPFLRLNKANDKNAGYEHLGSGSLHPLHRIEPPALIAFKGGNVEIEINRVRVNKQIRSVNVIDLIFQGSELPATAEKKIVIVKF